MFGRSVPQRRRVGSGGLPRAARLVAFAMAVSLVLTMSEQPAAVAAPPVPRTLSAQQVPSTVGSRVAAMARPLDLSQGAAGAHRIAARWPTGVEVVDLARPAVTLATLFDLARGVRRVRAGRLPVWVSPVAGAASARVRVDVRDRASVPAVWRDGLVMEVARADAGRGGTATVSVDYADFAQAYGGDWAARLRLVRLPACALTTPELAGCAAQPLRSTNHAGSARVSAEVPLVGGGGILMALTGGASGSAGDFTASSLQASSTWSAGNNSGSFSWSYPVRTPPSLGGPSPKVSLGYSSAAVDGRSQATNNQPSWVGEGFDWSPGYIERRYAACSDDMEGGNNSTETGDQCWRTDNATMSLNGAGGELIKDDATGTWKVRNDDNSKIERLTNTVNGDDDNEYWKITTADGTQYYFGLNRLPGYTGTAPANKTTNAAWTVPVAGNHSGEQCHAATFAGSFCDQAWRWNLDYVVDPHGNTMSLYYVKETNKYGRNNTATDAVTYTRGGYLEHIDYGSDKRSGTDTANTATKPPMRIDFAVADRCLSSCTVDANWPDTPLDQECAGSSCVGQHSATFWTKKRLTTITTKVFNAATADYKEVDSWALTHTFPDPGDGTRAGMWLESLVHTGKAAGPAIVGGNVAMPEINFDWVQLPNRVDSTDDGQFPMNWMRMSTIWTETGGKIDIRYSAPQCVAGSVMPASPQANDKLCYPVLREKPDGSIATDYFHKYLVTAVTEADRTGGGPDVETRYEYVGTPAWRHTDDDGITKDHLRTWSDYRGFAQVKVRLGDPGSGTETLTTTTFFRGMHGDLNGSGGTRTVTLAAIDGNGDGDTSDPADAAVANDENFYSGLPRQTTVYNGVDTQPISSTFYQPWQSAPTATRDMGDTDAYARHTGNEKTWVAKKIFNGGWRVSRSISTFDAGYGMVTQVDDSGDLATADDEQCVKTTYVRNTGANILSLTGRTETYALACATAPTSEADVISDTRTSFDGLAYGAAPTRGKATRTEVAKAWTSGTPTWLTVSTMDHDDYGRTDDVTDVRGNHTTTVYTPATGPVTSIATTTGLGTTTNTVEPAWGFPTATVDLNNKRSDVTYDALGRTKQVWLANRLKASYPSAPSSTYTYLIRASGGVNAVTTATLNAATSGTNSYYTTTYALYDGLLRPRQTQSPSKANGSAGTVFTETKYDSHGRVRATSQHFDASVQPSTDLYGINDWTPLTQTLTEYDRAGRKTASVFRRLGTEKWRTTTTYLGDRVSVLPPEGGTASTTISDGRGRTIEVRQYHDPADLGSDVRAEYDRVTYHFDRKGHQDSAADNAGNVWTVAFDLLGRAVETVDPDKGETTVDLSDAGDVESSTDESGATLVFTYDAYGRRTGTYAGSVSTANKLATWAYDPLGFKGQLSSSSRWRNSGTEEFKVKIKSYTALYQSTGEDYIIPATTLTTGLSGTHTINRSYRFDGSPATLSYPAAGGLAQETVTYTYDTVTGLPEQLQTNSGQGQYVNNTDYTAYGELSFLEYKLSTGSWVQRSFNYDDSTHRLEQSTSLRQTLPQAVEFTDYDYDKLGNIIRIAGSAAGSASDVQCFDHDYVQRLEHAWTPTSGDCNASKSAAALGGPEPYWLSWTYDEVGNRESQTKHATAGDVLTSYAYPAAGSDRPHAVLSTTTGAVTQNYGYDSSGNTTCRPSGSTANTCPPGAGSQTLVWDPEGHIASVSAGGSTSAYLYTADGARLIADDPTSVTLYLPGTELKRTKSTGVVTPTRYFGWAGQTCAMKTTGGAVTWLIGDHQNTQSAAVAAGTQAITTRRQTPFGGPRSGAVSWPNPKGFVGGDNDVTGLVHIGAREYDTALGRFVAPDPIFNQADPQSWTGYAYANNSPITSSDPTGLMVESGGGSGGASSGSTSSNSNGPCNYSNAYAQGYCQSAQNTQTTSASSTTRASDPEAEACYQLARAGQGGFCGTITYTGQQCYDRARSGMSCTSTTTERLASYSQRVEEENQQRAAEVAAAIEAEKQAEEESCSGFWGCLSSITDSPVWDIAKTALGVAALFGCAVCGVVAFAMSAVELVVAIHDGDGMGIVFGVAEVITFGMGSKIAMTAKYAKKGADAAKKAAANPLNKGGKSWSGNKQRQHNNTARREGNAYKRAEAEKNFWDKVIEKTLFGFATSLTVGEQLSE